MIHNDNIDEVMRKIIEEARVILPGVQALFGFQTIAVFNDRFVELPSYAKTCHLIGLGMVVVTIAMVMTPAVYYRACGGNATASMMGVATSLIRAALWPLSLGLSLDMFTVIYVATTSVRVSIAAAIGTFVLLAGFWFTLPARGRQRDKCRDRSITF